MAQTSVEWIYHELVVFMTGNSDFESAEELFNYGNAMHKEDCIKFSIEWENRRDDEDIKSKEDLYNLIFNK